MKFEVPSAEVLPSVQYWWYSKVTGIASHGEERPLLPTPPKTFSARPTSVRSARYTFLAQHTSKKE
jgi:hypothetical protein